MSKPVVGAVRKWDRTPAGRIDQGQISVDTACLVLDGIRDTLRSMKEVKGVDVDIVYDDGSLWFDLVTPQYWTPAEVDAELRRLAAAPRREMLLAQQRSIAQTIGYKVASGEPYDEFVAELRKNREDLAKLESEVNDV